MPAVRKVAMPLGTTLLATLLAIHTLRVRARARRQMQERHQISQVGRRIEEQIPAMGNLHSAKAAISSIVAAVQAFAVGVRRLAASFSQCGAELEKAFPEFGALPDLGDDLRPVHIQCTAWNGVGETESACAVHMLEISNSLSQLAEEAEKEKMKCFEEVRHLREDLARAELDFEIARGRKCWFSWFVAETRTAEDDARERQLLDGRWFHCATAIDRLSKQLDGLRSRTASTLADAAADVRGMAADIGNKMAVLGPKQRPPTITKSQKMEGFIKAMSTADGRQRLRDAEVSVEVAKPIIPLKEAMLVPPLLNNGPTEWRINGVYHHQILKIGLRQLDLSWPVNDLLSFPRGKDGSSLLFRERLFRELLEGTLRLQSITRNDIAAAQRDMDRLSLRQLLRLRVSHLDFTPSGCGADSVSAVGGTHEVFLNKLDGLLFRQLGQKAVKGPIAEHLDSGEMHRVGRETVLFAAAAAAIRHPPWWCWWITDQQRIFFNVESFVCSRNFADGGVLEVTDYSRKDKHEPTGNLRWFDWRVDLVSQESSLSPSSAGRMDTTELGHASVAGASSLNKSAHPNGSTNAAGPAASMPEESAPTTSATGAGAAAMVSPEVLRGLKSSLRRANVKETAPRHT
eukprot:CAMPEP_0172899440 /NCGR_PEP_ID=MMETSP1075-20121228/161798_1 /TAXON_ID=2916 /ORGANISM="Ceratium fusus, Strain PA161109" /LENGTH=628 /DNA_ID=CAMNT_0013755427 /DNA_START=17 /DNA_END=1903 /DNA_ORIENTATION=-